MRRLLVFVAMLAAAGCSSGGTETVEVTTTLQVTTTVQAAPTIETTTEPEVPSTDPDDVAGQLDVRNFGATRNGDLLAVSLSTYEAWNGSVLAGPGEGKQGPNRITVEYDVDLDGVPDYRGRVIWSGRELSLHLAGSGSAFEPVPVERPDNVTAQYVHPVDVLFITTGGSSNASVQVRVRTVFNGAVDRAPDSGWLRVPSA
jgi:hypothetical protein